MEVIVATKNRGKLLELERILNPMGFELRTLDDVGYTDQIIEDGKTFLENACIKAMKVHEVTGKAVIADDSGLCIDALEGRPGIYTARYAGENSTYTEKMESLLRELKDVPAHERTAYFACAICYVDEQGEKSAVFERCDGTIGQEIAYGGGFGYDPIFVVDGKSFAELPGYEKDKLSHRGKALRSLEKILKSKQIEEK